MAVLVALLVSFLGARPVACSGLLIFEQGTKPMGMASAFAAQANDPSTLFFNPGGLPFFSEEEFLAGLTIISGNGHFRGEHPSTGEPIGSERAPLYEFPPHLFWIKPLSDRWNLGLAEYTPFGLVSDWNDKSDFPGRFVSEEFLLRTIDLNANLGYQLNPKVGLGFGLVARFSDFEHSRRLARDGENDPVEIGSLAAESDLEMGLGWNVGILLMPSRRTRFGLSYRSRVSIDYEGEVTARSLDTDTSLAELLQVDRDLSLRSTIRYPDIVIIGVAVEVSPRLLLEVDLNWTGWSSFKGIVLEIPEAPDLTERLLSPFNDSISWRAGIQYTTALGKQYRGGIVIEGTPQPASDVSPVLADADRIGFSVGLGFSIFDFSLMYLKFDDRGAGSKRFGPEGVYSTDAWLAGVTVGF